VVGLLACVRGAAVWVTVDPCSNWARTSIAVVFYWPQSGYIPIRPTSVKGPRAFNASPILLSPFPLSAEPAVEALLAIVRRCLPAALQLNAYESAVVEAGAGATTLIPVPPELVPLYAAQAAQSSQQAQSGPPSLS